jgi:hypothetical protein
MSYAFFTKILFLAILCQTTSTQTGVTENDASQTNGTADKSDAPKLPKNKLKSISLRLKKIEWNLKEDLKNKTVAIKEIKEDIELAHSALVRYGLGDNKKFGQKTSRWLDEIEEHNNKIMIQNFINRTNAKIDDCKKLLRNSECDATYTKGIKINQAKKTIEKENLYWLKLKQSWNVYQSLPINYQNQPALKTLKIDMAKTLKNLSEHNETNHQDKFLSHWEQTKDQVDELKKELQPDVITLIIKNSQGNNDSRKLLMIKKLTIINNANKNIKHSKQTLKN